MTEEVNKEKNSFKDYFAVNDVFKYFLRVFKKDPNAKGNLNLKMMHGVNRISILVFILAVIVLITRRLFLD